MSGNISALIRQSRGERPAEEADEPDETHACYARLRGPRQVAFMLELRAADGSSNAFDYGLLGRVRFDPSDGLVLHFGTGLVTVRGRNLRPVFEGILTHRVTWVAEALDPAAAARDPGANVVTVIEVAAAG